MFLIGLVEKCSVKTKVIKSKLYHHFGWISDDFLLKVQKNSQKKVPRFLIHVYIKCLIILKYNSAVLKVIFWTIPFWKQISDIWRNKWNNIWAFKLHHFITQKLIMKIQPGQHISYKHNTYTTVASLVYSTAQVVFQNPHPPNIFGCSLGPQKKKTVAPVTVRACNMGRNKSPYEKVPDPVA